MLNCIRLKQLIFKHCCFWLPLLSFNCQEAGSSKFIATVDSVLTASDFNGVVFISKKGKSIYEKAQGFSNLELKEQLTVGDQFVIGSISKQITVVLVLREWESGRLSLNDTISQYLPHIKQPWIDQISIHQLLTHTHGIQSLNEPLAFKPGAQFQYSQLGYELLAQVLENVSGTSFEEMATSLFETFNLTSTYHPSHQRDQNLVKGYVENESGQLVYEPNSLYNYVPAGSFISNAYDLDQWNTLLHNGQLVREETLRLMTTRYATRIHPIFGSVEYGYGLLFKKDQAGTEVGALGYAPGFVSASYYYPKSGLSLVVLENTARNLDDFSRTFLIHTTLMELAATATSELALDRTH